MKGVINSIKIKISVGLIKFIRFSKAFNPVFGFLWIFTDYEMKGLLKSYLWNQQQEKANQEQNIVKGDELHSRMCVLYLITHFNSVN